MDRESVQMWMVLSSLVRAKERALLMVMNSSDCKIEQLCESLHEAL